MDLAEPFPKLFSTEINIVGLLYFSLIREATIPIIPSCQLVPESTKTGSLTYFFA